MTTDPLHYLEALLLVASGVVVVRWIPRLSIKALLAVVLLGSLSIWLMVRFGA